VIEASRQEFSVPFRSIEAQDIREPLVRYEARRPVTVLANLLAQFSRPALRWDADAMVGGHEEPDQRTVLFARDADAHPLRSSPELPPPRSDVSTGMRHHLALARSVHGLPLACIFGMVELYDRVGSAQDVDPATVAPSEAVRDALRQGDFDPLDARRFSDRPRSP
jgi:hypothetical protein